MWLSCVASIAVSLGGPRELKKPHFDPRPGYSFNGLLPETSFSEALQVRGGQTVLDGWAFYAKAGGMVVATGQATNPWVYDCNTAWNGEVPFCRIGRTQIKMPNHLFIVAGMAFLVAQDQIRRSRGATVGPRYKVRDVFANGRLNIRALVAVLPLLNFSVLEQGAYGNILVSL